MAVEVAAPQSGVLHEITIDVGAEAGPGALLGLVRLGNSAARPVAATKTEPPHDTETPNERLSPLVQALLAQNGLSASDIPGSGRDGRVTHEDVVAFLAKRDTKPIVSVTPPVKAGPRSTQSDAARDRRAHGPLAGDGRRM